MRGRALIVPAFAAALLLGGGAYARDAATGGRAGVGATAGTPAAGAQVQGGAAIGATVQPSGQPSGKAGLGPVGAGTSPGPAGGAAFGARDTTGDGNADARSRVDAQLQAARERMSNKADARLGLDAAAAQRAQSR